MGIRDVNAEALADAAEPADSALGTKALAVAIGRQVRQFRTEMGLTVAELARLAGLSPGMLSKIENGNASPSLTTIHALAYALNVPVTSFFRKYDEQREVTYVKAGEGMPVERRGTAAGHHYQLLGRAADNRVCVEPCLVTLTKKYDVVPVFHHSGVEFIYMLEGELSYRHGDKSYLLTAGNSLFFHADAPHGPQEILRLPVKFLSVIIQPRSEE